MRVALFGGSFDPPHRGHVALARLARERLALDRVLVAPVAVQPLKPDAAPASFDDRVAMARLAFADEPGVEVSLLDAPRSDGKSNYTLETLETLRRRLSPDDALFCILGADSLLSIGQWHRPAQLLTACDFIVGARPGFNLSDVEGALPGGIRAKPLATELPGTRLLELAASNGRRSRLYLLTDLAEDVSANEIRSALLQKANPGSVLHPAVAEYIRAHPLYPHL
ncbi:MAG: nicotinate (nicotinamide) nucleotide adenylyltransferase [Acidobacteriaceae bacterium]